MKIHLPSIAVFAATLPIAARAIAERHAIETADRAMPAGTGPITSARPAQSVLRK